MSNDSPVFCALYRWRLHPGSEQTFVEAWSRVTHLLLTERGSLGSRLHRGPDDVWYSYTQWPSAAAKAEGLARPSVDAEAWERMRSCIAESLPELILEPVADFLAPLPSGECSGENDPTPFPEQIYPTPKVGQSELSRSVLEKCTLTPISDPYFVSSRVCAHQKQREVASVEAVALFDNLLLFDLSI